MHRRVALLALCALLACGPQDSPLDPGRGDTQAPTALVSILDAGEAVVGDGRVEVGETFFLDGARSTDAGGGRIAGYAWTFPGGTVVRTVQARIDVQDAVGTLFEVGEYMFGLTVVDDSGNESELVEVTVSVVDRQPPTAVLEVLDASGEVDGDGRFEAGSAFSLGGSRSMDAAGRIVRYDWVLPNAPPVTTDSPTLAVTEVVSTPFGPGSHVFGLRVVDDSGNESELVEVTVVVTDTQAPTAVLEVLNAAGEVDPDGRIEAGSAFSLGGSRSTDAAGRIVRYDWVLPNAPPVTTDSPTLAVTEVVTTPFGPGSHVFGLRVVDDSGNQSELVEVTVVVTDTQAPTAVLDVLDASGEVDADGRIEAGSAFSLGGSRSADAAGRIVRYNWVLPNAPPVTTDSPTLAVTEVVSTPFGPASHVFGLRVVDDSGNQSELVEVTVVVTDTQAPTAVLEVLDASGEVDADGRILVGSAFSLGGSRSADAAGRIVRYNWVLPNAPLVTTDSPTLAVTEVVSTPFGPGPHVFGLRVVDDSGNQSELAEVTVTLIEPDTEAPTAVLTAIYPGGRPVIGSVPAGTPFLLSGTGSSDAGGQVVRYDWLLPDATTVRTDIPTLAVTEVVSTPLEAGSHTFGLTVTDDSGNRSTLVRITVTVGR